MILQHQLQHIVFLCKLVLHIFHWYMLTLYTCCSKSVLNEQILPDLTPDLFVLLAARQTEDSKGNQPPGSPGFLICLFLILASCFFFG